MGNVLGISGTFDHQLYKGSVWEWRVGPHCWHESMCGARCVYRRKRTIHFGKLLLFTLLITAALRSRLMSKCCFSAALCPRQSNMVLRTKRKCKMICSSDRSDSVSFLSVSLSPPGALPHTQMGGGTSVLPAGLDSRGCSGEVSAQLDSPNLTLIFMVGQNLGCDFGKSAVEGALLQSRSGAQQRWRLCKREVKSCCLLSSPWRKNSVMKLDKC